VPDAIVRRDSGLMSSVRGESRDLGVAHALAACSPGPVRLFMD
jgi:hypothetical protein